MTHTRFFEFILYSLELHHLELQLQPMIASSTWSWTQVQQSSHFFRMRSSSNPLLFPYVHFQDISYHITLPIVVVQSQGPTLLSRNWLQSTQLDWKSIKGVYWKSLIEELIKKYSHLFHSELRTIQGVKAKIFVPPEAHPCFFKPRLLPYTLKSRVEAKLEQLVQAEIITPTQFSDWSAPIIPVIKADGNIHVCGDYKITVNSVAKPEVYPLLRVDDLFTALSGGTLFSKLDLSHTYKQLELDEESKNTLSLILLKDSSNTNSCHLAYLCPVHFSEDNRKFNARPIRGCSLHR